MPSFPWPPVGCFCAFFFFFFFFLTRFGRAVPSLFVTWFTHSIFSMGLSAPYGASWRSLAKVIASPSPSIFMYQKLCSWTDLPVLAPSDSMALEEHFVVFWQLRFAVLQPLPVCRVILCWTTVASSTVCCTLSTYTHSVLNERGGQWSHAASPQHSLSIITWRIRIVLWSSLFIVASSWSTG